MSGYKDKLINGSDSAAIKEFFTIWVNSWTSGPSGTKNCQVPIFDSATRIGLSSVYLRIMCSAFFTDSSDIVVVFGDSQSKIWTLLKGEYPNCSRRRQ